MYKLTQNTSIIRLADGAIIPADIANGDYARYLSWVSKGGTPTPAGPIPTAYPTINAKQLRMALARSASLRSQLETAVQSGTLDMQDWYKFSQVFTRNDPSVIALGAAIGATAAQLDAVWALGATL